MARFNPNEMVEKEYTSYEQLDDLSYARKVTQVDTSGGDANVPLGQVDSGNSSADTLLSGIAFTGTSIDVSKFGIVYVSVSTDVASATDGLSIQQSVDGTNWDFSDDFTIPAGGNKNFSINPHAQYLRVVYTNGSTGQGHFRLQTILKQTGKSSTHRIQDAIVSDDDAELNKSVITGVNRAGQFVNATMTNEGLFRVALEQPLTAFGDMRTIELRPQMQGSFEYTVDNTTLNENFVANTGSVTQSEAMAVVSTGTTTGSSARLESRQHAKYRPGLGGLLRFTALFTTPVANTDQIIGLMDEVGSTALFKNGYAIGFNGTGTFTVFRFQNDVMFEVAQADLDDSLDGTGLSGLNIDFTKLNVFAINFQYLGAGAINFFIEDPDNGEFVKFHTIKYAGANTTPSVHNPNFHFQVYTDNKATTEDLVVKTASYAYFIEGQTFLSELHQPKVSTGIQTQTGVTTAQPIVTIRNKANYAGKVNYIDAYVLNISSAYEANNASNTGAVAFIKNATLGGTAASWIDISTTDSVIEYDVSSTTVTGGTVLIAVPLSGKNDKALVDLSAYDIILNPEDTLTVVGTSTNSAEFNASILWRELF